MDFINVTRHLEEWNMSYTYPNNIFFRFLWHLSIFVPDCCLWSEERALICLPWEWPPPAPTSTIERQMRASALAGHLIIQKQVSGEPQYDFLSFQSQKEKFLPLMMAPKTRPKWSFAAGALVLPFSAVMCFDIKTSSGNTILPYLLPSNEALLHYGLSHMHTFCKTRHFILLVYHWRREAAKGSSSLADIGLSMNVFSSEGHQQQTAPGDIAAIASGLQAATSSWIRLLHPTPTLSDLLA